MKRVIQAMRGASFFLMALAGTSPALAQIGATCGVTTAPVSVRLGGVAERTADVVVNCNGGAPTGNGQAVPNGSFSLTFSVNTTGRQLAGGWSEALLVVDEPTVANQRFCATDNSICTIIGNGTGVGIYNGSVGRPNVYQASQSANNGLTWPSVPIDPPGSSGQRVFRFTNLRVSTLGLSPGSTVEAQLTVGTLPLGPPVVVAQAEAPLLVSNGGTQLSGARLSRFTVDVEEGFGQVLKPRSLGGAGALAQSQPGGVPFGTETGFFNTGFPVTVRGNAGNAGNPDSGTRIRFRFTGVPSKVSFSAPTVISYGSGGQVQLVTTDANGAGPFQQAFGLTNTGGTITAVYEVLAGTSAVDTLSVPFTVNYPDTTTSLLSVTGDVALVPVSGSGAASQTAPIPRFNALYPFFAGPPVTIVTQFLPNAAVGLSFSRTIEAVGGLPPYTFSVSMEGSSLPPGLTLTESGNLVGTPTTPGTYQFTVRVLDSVEESDTADFEVTVGFPIVQFQSSVSALNFTAIQGGATPPPKALDLAPTQGAQAYEVTLDGGQTNIPAPTWLNATPRSGAPPALLKVVVNQGSLVPGVYAARIQVGAPNQAGVPLLMIPVTLTVTAAPAPELEALPSSLRFTRRFTAPGTSEARLLLRNKGGTALPFTSSVRNSSTWITLLTPSTGTVSPGTPVAARVVVDSTGLAPGVYHDEVRFAWSGGKLDIPVTLRVAPVGSVLTLNRRGARFATQVGVVPPQVRTIKIGNQTPGSPLPWTAELVEGDAWFLLSPASGSATSVSPSELKVQLKQAVGSLAAGNYYGLVRITAQGAYASPRYVTVMLEVRDPAQSAPLSVDPGGLVLTAIQGSTEGTLSGFTLSTSRPASAGFQVAVSTESGGGWLSAVPSNGGFSVLSEANISVTANPTGLPAGVYFGHVTIATPSGVRSVPVTFVVTGAQSDGSKGLRGAGCTASSIAVTSTGLPDSFSVPAGWPSQLDVRVADNCGVSVADATVVVSFSNGDPPLMLEADDLAPGVYSATWQPGTVAAQMSVNIHALTGAFAPVLVTLSGAVEANAAPTLDQGGTVNPFDSVVGGLLTGGMPVAVYGQGLNTAAESTAVPLPTQYKGTRVLVGTANAGIYYVSDRLVNVQFPNELAPGATYPVVALVNGAITMPQEADVVGVQPQIARFVDGKLIAQHTDVIPYQLVDDAHPAKRGEILVMYLVGMGPTQPAVPNGFATPSVAPIPQPVTVPTMTLDGKPIVPDFVGMTPTAIGLFQINFRIPQDTRLNAPLELIVKQGSATSKVATLTVVP